MYFKNQGSNFTLSLLFLLVITINLSSASLGIGIDSEIGINLIPSHPTNYSTINVNNSQYLRGLTPQQVANLYTETDPIWTAVSGDYVPYIGIKNIITSGNITADWGVFNSINVSNESIYVGGIKISTTENNTLEISSNVSAPFFEGDGSHLTNLNLTGIDINAGSINVTGNITASWFNGNWSGSLWKRIGTTISPKILGDDITTIGELQSRYLRVNSTDGLDQIRIYHNNTDAHFKTTNGAFYFKSDEVKVKGNGINHGILNVYNSGGSGYMTFQPGYNGEGFISMVGAAATSLSFQANSNIPIKMFERAIAGETQELTIYGYRTGDTCRSLQIGVGTDASNTASFDGVDNYLFDGNIKLRKDNQKLFFGKGEDVSISFNSTDWLFNPRELGNGDGWLLDTWHIETLIPGTLIPREQGFSYEGLVGYWKGNSNPNNCSGEGNDGNLQGDTTYSNARFGKGFEFDGDGDFVNCGNDTSLDITNAITIEMWVKPNDADENGYIIAKTEYSAATGGYGIQWGGSSDTLYFIGGNNYVSSNGVFVDDNVWVHVVVTKNSSDAIVFYRNGESVGTDTLSIPSGSLDLLIGKRNNPSGAGHYFNGTIDDVMIFNRSLSAEEIKSLYESNVEKYCKESGLTGNYSVGNCWMNYKGGLLTSTNCTAY